VLDKENETAPTSDDTAFKPRSHELFEREQQLILTDRCDYPLIKVVIYERLTFPEFFDCPPFVAEHDEIPDEVVCRFAHGLYLHSQRRQLQKSPPLSHRRHESETHDVKYN
jgi:hypothetical protein